MSELIKINPEENSLFDKLQIEDETTIYEYDIECIRKKGLLLCTKNSEQ